MLCCFWSEAAVATLRFKSFVQAALSSKVNAESVESLLKQTKMLDEREPASPPSELVHMWPEGNEVHSSPLLWPASPYAAQLIGIKSFVAGMRSEQWRSSVYERAVVDMMAYGVEMDMVQLWEPEGPSVGDTITRHKLVRRRISREGNTWQSGLDALMRLPWASELCTETSGAPEAVSWAEVLCLKHLPSQLKEAPWAAELKEVLDAMGSDRAQDGERCGKTGEKASWAGQDGERGEAHCVGMLRAVWRSVDGELEEGELAKVQPGELGALPASASSWAGEPLDRPASGATLTACAHTPLGPLLFWCIAAGQDQPDRESPLLWPSVANMPVFDAADACNRVYQITVSATHTISGTWLKKILQALDAKRGGGPASADRRLQLVWLVPPAMASEAGKSGRRPITGVDDDTCNQLRQQFDEYVVGVDFNALAGVHSAAIKSLVCTGRVDPVDDAAAQAPSTSE